MDVLDAIKSRKVQRNFAAQAVAPEKLRQIVSAGRHAMSARNKQPWQFIVIQNRDTLREIGAVCTTGKFVTDAPSAIVVLKDTTNTRWADVDCAQAVQNMATAAWGLGLGTCWVGNFDGAQIKKILAVPDGWDVFTVLPFGYPDPANPPQVRPLKPSRENVHFERFGNPGN
ncbi:MAG TPA: nitroreductase family protein [Candidatus Binataceae bacterium]|nr:nitroreductase family protein [Candidatus Binataceae bacterium]